MIPDLDRLRIERAEGGLGPSPAKKRWRLLLLIGGGLILLLAVLYLWGPLKPSQEVTAAVVSRIYPSQAYTLLNASGYVVPQRQAAVSSKSTGRLAYLGVEEGSRVKKGQIMAALENEDLVAQRNQAAAQVKDAQAALDTAQAELVDARLQYERYKTLVQQDLVARQDFDSAQARFHKAQAQVAAARAQINASQANLANAQAALEYSYIRSPFDGVVLTKNADVGEVVAPFGAAATAKASVVTMADFASLMVEADVAEANLDKVHRGQPCEIALDAIPDQRFRGEVHMIVPTADRAKATVMTKVKFLELDDRILPEMSAKVAFLSQPLETGETKPLLAVNQSALITRNGKRMAFLVRENHVRLTEVAVGEEMGELVEITGGLKEGDRVVLNPPASLKDGDRVRLKEG
ncbi:MAG: efflux RND transporter periplasmic adaptor subunit [Deltaproteobacteria bacterium]|nr:efflux RND transporter periplasmic adaptor subunit [Deltaproteobacteria bacterium]